MGRLRSSRKSQGDATRLAQCHSRTPCARCHAGPTPTFIRAIAHLPLWKDVETPFDG